MQKLLRILFCFSLNQESSVPSKARFIACLLLFFPIVSFGQLTADFTIDKPAGCSPLAVQFTDASTGGATSWQWDLGNGNNSTNANPSATYIDSKVYTVTLTVTKDGQTSTKSKTVTVFQNPVANFSASNNQGCLPIDIAFKDLSVKGSANITSWFWDFGDGSSSNEQSPLHKYQQAGSFKVALILTDANGCTHTLTRPGFINIAPSSQTFLSFNADQRSGCELPFKVNFSNNSFGNGLSYLWHFGNGQTSVSSSPVHTYAAAGVYDVMLVARNSAGCQDTLKRKQFIDIFTPAPDFTANITSACAFENIYFTDLSVPSVTAWHWNFGDGDTSNVPNPVHKYRASGAYKVSLRASFGSNCKRTAIKDGYIVIKPSGAKFTSDLQEGCTVPFTVKFTDQTAAATSWTWDFGDSTASSKSTIQHPTHTYTKYGKYTVNLATTRNGSNCVEAIEKKEYIIIEKREPGFKANKRKGCIPLSVTFTDTIVSSHPIVAWHWDFGDGTTSNQQTPTHIFTSEQVYDITLVTTNAIGCKDTITRKGYIRAGFPPTKVDFVSDKQDVCASEPVQFTDLSEHVNGWYWDYGKGIQDSVQHPLALFRDTGTFHVTLIAEFNGCKDTLIKKFYMHVSPPVALFSLSSTCEEPYKYLIREFSIDAKTWEWDFGDGTPISTARNDSVYHVFPDRGFYDVKLKVQNFKGCIDTTGLAVLIVDPKAKFSTAPVSGCPPLIVSITDESTNAERWKWDFGNGKTTTRQNASYMYSDTGRYTITLIVDSAGCYDTLTVVDKVVVGVLDANFELDTAYGCKPLIVAFKETSTPQTGIISYTWDFGDGKTFSGKNPPPHTYPVAADYDVKLIIASASCTDTVVKKKFIQFPTKTSPDFFVLDTLTCKNTPVTCIAAVQKTSLIYQWDFGDGATSSDRNPSHYYTKDGTYFITLKVTDGQGCDSSMTKKVVIQDPFADFTGTPRFRSCPNLFATFTNRSSPNVTSWNWNFGDGSTSSLEHPTHVYTTTDSNDVTLTVSTRLGCRATLKIPNYIVIASPKADFTFNPAKGCPPLTVDFLTNTTNITKYQWDFGDGAPFGNGNAVQHDYDTRGTYYPRLILTDSIGCILSFQSPDPIVVKDLEVKGGNNKYICLYDSAVVGVSGEGTTTFWTPTIGLQNPNVAITKASPPKTTTYYMETRMGKCSNKDTVTVFVNPSFPTANFNASSVCLKDSTVFTDLSTVSGMDKIKTWSWTFGDGATAALQHVKHRYAVAKTYMVSLKVTTDSGCVDTVSKTARVYHLPDVNFSTAGKCLTDQIKFTNLSSDIDGIKSQQWIMGDSIGTASTVDYAYTYKDTGKYVARLVVTSNNTCKDTAAKEIYINPIPSPDFTSIGGACILVPVQFENRSTLSRGNIVKWQWAFGDGGTSQAEDTAYAYLQPGSFPVTLTATSDSGCVNTKSKPGWITTTPIPAADFSIRPEDSGKLLNHNFIFGNKSINAITYSWDFGDGTSSVIKSPQHMFGDTGTYKVLLTATGNNGCQDTIAQKVVVLPDFAFYIPNAFTPNGDKVNDTFIGYGVGVSKFTMYIFDRWGNKIYETNSLKEPWDGKVSGGKEMAQIDVYVYHMIVRDVFLETHTYTGHFTLIK